MNPGLSLLAADDLRLREPAAPVSWPDAAVAAETAQLRATLDRLRAETGVGRALAAPQVGIARRMIVVDLGAGSFVLMNPEVTWRSDDTRLVWDDCFSLPDCVVRVRRHVGISLRYRDEAGRERRWERLPPDLAELLQHELDHLEGVLMDARADGEDAVRPASARAALVDAARPARRLSLERIARSRSVIAPEFLDSPQFDCESLSEALGCSLTIKLDFTNPIRSFKGRGASFFVHELLARGDRRPLVCASAGNWGQAMAWVCRARGLPLQVYAATNANALKVARMKAFGATVVQEGADFDAAKDVARAHAARIGGWMVEDGLEPEISEGHGTIAIELLSRGDAYDAVVVPLGNGALLNGIARWMKAASPATRMIGVCSTRAPSMAQSWRLRRIVETTRADTIADGIAVRVPIPEAVDDMQGLVDDVLLVDDRQIAEAVRLAWRHAGLLLEPTGAVGLAAILAHPDEFNCRRVATVLCGSNITDAQANQVLSAASGGPAIRFRGAPEP